MNATVQDMLKQYAQQVRKETRIEVINEIAERINIYHHLLYNDTAHNIMLNAKGIRYKQLVAMREKINTKWRTTNEIMGTIFANMK